MSTNGSGSYVAPSTIGKCEGCDSCSRKAYFCAFCDGYFCDIAWPKERSHKPGRVGPDGLPHEKADPEVVSRLKETFSPPSDSNELEALHIDDEDTTWFSIARNSSNLPTFQDHGRYATLMANSALLEHGTRYPQLVSFIGQTGAGKSTLVKLLIEQQSGYLDERGQPIFPCPVVGSLRNENVPTSGDVHLYADPKTYLGQAPLLYADCEGLEGGETSPQGIRHRMKEDSAHGRQRSDSTYQNEKKRRKRGRGQQQDEPNIGRGSQRDIAWATSPGKRKRQYAVTELYPRLLYTFSDAIVFVLRNPKTFQSTVLSHLLNWASTSMEKSLNQPTLPHAIIVLNATDTSVDTEVWDTDHATQALLSSVANAIDENIKFREYADYWMSQGRQIHTMKDLLECYYSSVTVIRVPTKGRYMLIDEQVTKLREQIAKTCEKSQYEKRRARMLSNSNELNVYLQSAFDHFANNLEAPFNFIEIAMKNSPIPSNFGGNILKLAVAVSHQEPRLTGPEIFRELSIMVASCIMLDCERNGRLGPARQLLEKYFMNHCDYALEDFCRLFVRCGFENRNGRCVNYAEGHTKGHQNAKGKIIGTGGHESDFTWQTFALEWIHLLQQHIETIQAEMVDQGVLKSTGKSIAAQKHASYMDAFYRRLGGAENFISHSVCFCCLREPPKHPLSCGHVLCDPCIEEYGIFESGSHRCIITMNSCPLHRNDEITDIASISSVAAYPSWPWQIKFKPKLAGVRVLCLDGGGIRGIVELEILRELERMLGDSIPIQNFFDLIVGTSTGGIIALGLGVEQWSVESCITKFTSLVDQAFTPYALPISYRYKSSPFKKALQGVFRDANMFGGQHEMSSSYFTKVAITTATEAGDRAVICTNYNRPIDSNSTYTFLRPTNPFHELKVWEAARATSAAPTFFKPFVNRRTNEGYLDGALFHNNPVRVAYHESKMIWPDVAHCHPDILLSLGTSHHLTDGGGSAEPNLRRPRSLLPLGNARDVRSDVAQRKGIGGFWKTSPLKFLQVLVNRVDNILSAQQIWQTFRGDVLDQGRDSDSRRYERINPNLGTRPPRFDDKAQLGALQAQIRNKIRDTNGSYRKKLIRIVHRLVASTFYFEKLRPPTEQNGSYGCPGRIHCRFYDGSTELRHLGNFLKYKQGSSFQPYFEISEEHCDSFRYLPIDKAIIESMITHSRFSLGEVVEVQISEKMGPVTIALCLQEDSTKAAESMPISGFPRDLFAEEVPQTPVTSEVSPPPNRANMRNILTKNNAAPLDHSASNSQDDLVAQGNQSRPVNEASGVQARRAEARGAVGVRGSAGSSPHFDRDEYELELAISRSLREQQGPQSTGAISGFVGIEEAIQESLRNQEQHTSSRSEADLVQEAMEQSRQEHQEQRAHRTRSEAELIAEAIEQSRREQEERERAAHRVDDDDDEELRKVIYLSLEEQQMHELDGSPPKRGTERAITTEMATLLRDSDEESKSTELSMYGGR